MYAHHQATAATPQPSVAPPRLHVDEAALDAHMGAVRRYYEQRLQQLENELAACRRTCRCHSGDHQRSAGSTPTQRATLFTAASSSSPAVTSSLMVSPISHRGAATTGPEARTENNPVIASSADGDAHMSSSERSMYGSRASLLFSSSTSPQRNEPSTSDRVLSHDHRYLPPQYPRIPQHNASQHNHQQSQSGGGSTALKALTASDHFFALPSQDYFRATLREVAGDSPPVAELHNR
jgi:hypothetical protein